MSFSILTLDLHNTIYDEVPEYGLALDEAVSVWLAAHPDIKRETLYAELAIAHKHLGSDWDDDVWTLLPSLKGAKEFDATLAKAIRQRHEKSKELALAGFYAGVHETLKALKARGVRIYVVTEAAADMGMQALGWLGLAGIVDGFYSYPSRKNPPAVAGTYTRAFPDGAKGVHLRKPHPYLLASVMLDDAVHKGAIPESIKLSDVFAVRQDDSLLIPELPATTPVQMDASARLVLKDTPYAAALKQTRDAMLYVGDSKFRDGFLARNAGVKFGLAAYGKRGHDSEMHKKGLAIMYETTGWDKDVMKITQEAGRSPTVNRLQPDFVFEKSLSEALNLFT